MKRKVYNCFDWNVKRKGTYANVVQEYENVALIGAVAKVISTSSCTVSAKNTELRHHHSCIMPKFNTFKIFSTLKIFNTMNCYANLGSSLGLSMDSKNQSVKIFSMVPPFQIRWKHIDACEQNSPSEINKMDSKDKMVVPIYQYDSYIASDLARKVILRLEHYELKNQVMQNESDKIDFYKQKNVEQSEEEQLEQKDPLIKRIDQLSKPQKWKLLRKVTEEVLHLEKAGMAQRTERGDVKVQNNDAQQEHLKEELTSLSVFEFNAKLRNRLAVLLGLNSSEISKFIWRLNSLYKKSMKKLDPGVVANIKKWFLDNDFRMPNRSEAASLLQYNNINYFHILKIRHQCIQENKKKNLTKLLNQISSILKKHGHEDADILSLEEDTSLCVELQLEIGLPFSTIQVLYAENVMKGEWDESKKHIIQNYLKGRNSGKLLPEEIDDLQVLTNLNRKQVLSYVHRVLSNKQKQEVKASTAKIAPQKVKMTPTMLEYVARKLKQNNYNITTELRRELQMFTGLNQSQISKCIRLLIDPPRILTQAAKDSIKNYYQSSGGNIKESDIEELKEKLKLSKQQIKRQLQQLK